MLNEVLWTIDNELSPSQFERLSIDLLYRNGFREIIPVEPQDAGRDAEELPREGRGQAGEAAFFQFSMEQDWRRKLRRDAQKLGKGGFEFSTLVFVTSRPTRGVDRDSLEHELRQRYGWDLIVFSREWLRLQLEEAHPDLAKKYLGVDVPEWSVHLAAKMLFSAKEDGGEHPAWLAFQVEDYERALAEFHSLLEAHPESAKAWQALGWCQYKTHMYEEALASLAKAVSLDPDAQVPSMRACILAEKGIRDGSKSLLIEARDIFRRVAESGQEPGWMTSFNLGNTLSALGEYKEAISWYLRALDSDEAKPMVWKNLATAYHHDEQHEEEVRCLDKALAAAPLMPEALVSKGICLVVDFGNPEGAVALLERAIHFNPNWVVHWPHVWYWMATACIDSGEIQRGLEWVEKGLAYQPDLQALRLLKLRLLSKLVPDRPDLVNQAKAFWTSWLAEQPLDFSVREQLVLQEARSGNANAAWDLLDECFGVLGVKYEASLRRTGFSVEESATALRYLPQYSLFRKRFPTSDYWLQEDPLYDLPFPPPLTPAAHDRLSACLCVCFGLCVYQLDIELPGRRRDEAVLDRFFETLGGHIERALIQCAPEFAQLVPPSSEGLEARVDAVTEIIMFLGLVSLREYGRQSGWILSQFRVPRETVDRALTRNEPSEIEAAVVGNAFVPLAEACELTGEAPPERRPPE